MSVNLPGANELTLHRPYRVDVEGLFAHSWQSCARRRGGYSCEFWALFSLVYVR